jgi:hypothetical protein
MVREKNNTTKNPRVGLGASTRLVSVYWFGRIRIHIRIRLLLQLFLINWTILMNSESQSVEETLDSEMQGLLKALRGGETMLVHSGSRFTGLI